MNRIARSFLVVTVALFAVLNVASAQTNAPSISDQTINGTIDQPINAQIQATNATNFEILSGQLPPGLILDPSTGGLTRAPTVAGTSTMTVRVTNASGAQASAKITFVIAGTNSQAVITNVSVDPGDHTYGVSVSVTFSRPVSVTLQPVLHMTVGGQPVVARFGYPDLSKTNRYVAQFFYATTNGVHGALAIQSPIDLLNGAIASDDGLAASLTFTPPDTSGVYVGDSGVAKTAQTITFTAPPDGLVIGKPVTLNAKSSAGLPIAYTLQGGEATINDGVLTPLSTETVIVRATSVGNDSVYSAFAQVNFGDPKPAAEHAVVANSSVDVTTDKPLTLTAPNTSVQAVTYSVVSGPAELHHDTITFTGSGNVTVRALSSVDSGQDATMTVVGHPVARFVNLSSRVHVSGSGDVATVGFVVNGDQPKQFLIRAVGDSLAGFGVTDGLANPTLTLFDGSRTAIASNSGWANDPQIAAAAGNVGAFPLDPGKTDAALLVTLSPGPYTAQITSNNSGSVLLEMYDVASTSAVPTKQLINLSTRAHLDGNGQVAQGFVISGDQPKRVLLRAVGSTLATFGVTDGVADPAIKVHAGSTVIASDDDWGTAGTGSTGVTLGTPADITTAAANVGAFSLPAGSKDAAVLVTLSPGLYTAVVTGNGASTGTVLVEAYEVP